MKKHLVTIIFFGSLWGIIEATVGYALHLLPISIYISGTILFPAASYILYKVYSITDSKKAVLAVGTVAAAIKAVNFLFPFGSPFKIINPMLSIIFESLIIFVVIGLIAKKDLKSQISGFILASIGWRSLYLGFAVYQYLTTGFVSSYLMNVKAVINFTLVYALISAGLAIGIYYLDLSISKQKKQISVFKTINPVVSVLTLVIAVVLSVIL